MDAHQIYHRSGSTSIDPTPGVIEMDLPILSALRYRRLYLGFFFQSEPAAGRIAINARFVSNSTIGDRARFGFDWAFPLSDLTSLASVGNNGGAACVPPFSVDPITDGASNPWPFIAESRRDEMIVAFPDIIASRVMRVRMMPIPVVCTADRLLVSVVASWTAGTLTNPGIQMFAGVRSSASFPG